MTDVPMFDMHPAARVCGRCGRPVLDPHSDDLCGYCIHLEHRTHSESCHWCGVARTAREAGDKGGAAAAAADPEFSDAVATAIAELAWTADPFTAADVRAKLESRGVAITRPAAIGSVFGYMHALGHIRPTGDFLNSPVKGQHGRPLRVWIAA